MSVDIFVKISLNHVNTKYYVFFYHLVYTLNFLKVTVNYQTKIERLENSFQT